MCRVNIHISDFRTAGASTAAPPVKYCYSTGTPPVPGPGAGPVKKKSNTAWLRHDVGSGSDSISVVV